MPHPGEQHASIANPFEEPKKVISEYTAQEVSILQNKLEKQLGPEYISARSGPSGQKVHYIAAEKCIALANEVFGFNGWSSSIQNIQVDFVDENPQTLKISLGLSVIVRVTLRDGTFHEDIGYGHIENCKGKAAAFEKAKKEGTTDALKRALRNFGNVLGNCIYDKNYLAKVTKMKVEPTKFNETSLHRHSDYVKKEQTEPPRIEAIKADADVSQAQSIDSFDDLLGEFDEVDFCVIEEEHPDEIALPNTAQTSSNEKPPNKPPTNAPSMQPPSRPLSRSVSAGNTYTAQPQTPNQPTARGQFTGGAHGQAAPRPPHQQFAHNRPQPAHNGPNNNHGPHQNGHSHQTPPRPLGSNSPAPSNGEVAGFFSARALSQLPEGSLRDGQVAPQPGQIFNLRAESPSIRKTPGIDHTKSKPVARNGQHIAPASPQSGTTAHAANASAPVTVGMAGRAGGPPGSQTGAGRGNVVNPQLDHARRIGAPGGPGSPLANRGQYRPPTIIHKRPLPGDGAGAGTGAAGRAPPSDASNNPGGSAAAAPAGAGAGGPDLKRQKMS